ncbi:MAG: GNAT family N-acetyltransferase [Gaiellaceae bacterium]
MAEFHIRPLEPADVDAAYEILADWQTKVFGEAEISHGMFSNFQEIVAAAYVAETPEGIVGHADVRADDVNVLVRGPQRRQGIGSALLRACEERAQGDTLRLIGLTDEPAAAPFAAANGYERAWEVWLMGVDLPTEPAPVAWPEGVAVRTFRDDDAPAVKDLLDKAYAAEPGHMPLSFEDWKTLMLGDPSFDPEAWFLVVADERIVGGALNWKEGYVKDLVVHPDWRGRGLGKALMLQTFAEFARRGIERVTLKTDSINPTGAWRLYERLGMKAERNYEVFEKRF